MSPCTATSAPRRGVLRITTRTVMLGLAVCATTPPAPPPGNRDHDKTFWLGMSFGVDQLGSLLQSLLPAGLVSGS